MFENTTKLLVWQKSHELVLDIYNIPKNFPSDELYGFTSQMRRAAVSIPSNISEGKARGSNKDFYRFLLITRGSLEELKYQLLLSKDLNYIDYSTYDKIIKLTKDVGKLLNGLMMSISK